MCECLHHRLGDSSRPCGREAKSKAGRLSSRTGRGPHECVALPRFVTLQASRGLGA